MENRNKIITNVNYLVTNRNYFGKVSQIFSFCYFNVMSKFRNDDYDKKNIFLLENCKL